MKYKTLIIIVLFFFITSFAFSQVNYSSQKKINWNKMLSYQKGNEENKQKFHYLYFDGAVYNDETLLPTFFELIYLKKLNYTNGNFTIKIENAKYIEINNNEKQNVLHLNNINSQIKINYHVAYSRNEPYLKINFIPLRKNKSTGKIEKLISFTLKITEIAPYNNGLKKNKNKYAQNSVLSTGKWVKIAIPETGIYKMTKEELSDIGFSNIQNIRVFGNDTGMLPFNNSEDREDDLVENKILKNSDYILFFAKNQNTWKYNSDKEMFLMNFHEYSDTAYYFLTDKNTGFNNNIQTENQSSQNANIELSSYDYYAHHEVETENLLHSGRVWLGESFSYENSQNFDFVFPGLINNSTLKLNVYVVGRTAVGCSFIFSSNSLSESVNIEKCGSDHSDWNYAKIRNKYYTYSAGTSDNISLNITLNKGTTSDNGWLNYINYNAKCKLILQNGQFQFRNNSSVGNDNITKYLISNAGTGTTVWDITDSRLPKKINITNSGTNTSFKVETSTLKEFVAFDGSSFLSPITNTASTGEITNQNLHATNTSTEMIIVTHPNFIAQAQELAQIHRDHDNMIVKVATTEEVYNEFSCGMPDVSAIRDYMRLVYENGNANLRYLLLFGDGSYNNRLQSEKNSNFILTFQALNSFNSDSNLTTISDDYFGLLDFDEGENNMIEKGLLDIGIGRLPVKDTDEASNMLKKIYSYLNHDNLGDWTNLICFVGDDEDSNTHMDHAERLSTKIDTLYPFFNSKKIYLDAFPQEKSSVGDIYPLATVEVNNRINKGVLIFNYTGHGSEQTLAHERLVTINDINNWTNFEHLSVFITATCEFSRFDDFSQETNETNTSAGEYVLLNPNGGAIAMFTTARVSYSGGNYTLNNNLYDFMFEDNEHGRNRFGDIYRLGKNKTFGPNKLNFTLLGDPALQLPFGKHNVVTNTLNSSNAHGIPDTIGALSKVTITGEIQDINGRKLNNFSGIVYPTVFDKNKEFKTLGNEEEGPFTYHYQNNILFKGRASIKNGTFSFTFIVPKDIYYNYGKGKISYYAKSSETDAKGYFNNFIVGGTSDDATNDTQGPTIKLFMNDSTFINGGMTDENPIVYALMIDSNGINTAGSGIGHDITATLDKNTNQMFILNDYYEADLDSYKSGKVEYGLFKLDPGDHSVKFKAWDVYNNSSEANVDFIVMESSDFSIKRLFNYPNPFTTNTSFYFEHNQPGTELEILLQIFTVSGKLVKTIHTQMNTDGFLSEPISWDGLDDFGSPIGRGVYIYRVKVRTQAGKIVEKYEKLLILK